MKFLNKMERKFGKFAIHNLMYYIIILNILGVFLGMLGMSGFFSAEEFYLKYLSLDISQLLRGQIWRVFTFIIYPRVVIGAFDILFLFLELYFYYRIGRELEYVWGTFRFNLYYLSGLLFNVIAAFILYVFHISVIYSPIGLTYINRALFLAYAATFPNMQILLSFIIPIKIKYLGYVYGAIIGLEVINYFRSGMYVVAIAILVALANFLIFFFATRNYRRISPKEFRRKSEFKKKMRKATIGTRHKCAVCGRTEEDNESLEFRFCSKCDGNYEYCSDHLFSHEHVKR